jgi:hypothetical protein
MVSHCDRELLGLSTFLVKSDNQGCKPGSYARLKSFMHLMGGKEPFPSIPCGKKFILIRLWWMVSLFMMECFWRWCLIPERRASDFKPRPIEFYKFSGLLTPIPFFFFSLFTCVNSVASIPSLLLFLINNPTPLPLLQLQPVHQVAPVTFEWNLIILGIPNSPPLN